MAIEQRIFHFDFIRHGKTVPLADGASSNLLSETDPKGRPGGRLYGKSLAIPDGPIEFLYSEEPRTAQTVTEIVYGIDRPNLEFKQMQTENLNPMGLSSERRQAALKALQSGNQAFVDYLLAPNVEGACETNETYRAVGDRLMKVLAKRFAAHAIKEGHFSESRVVAVSHQPCLEAFVKCWIDPCNNPTAFDHYEGPSLKIVYQNTNEQINIDEINVSVHGSTKCAVLKAVITGYVHAQSERR